MRVFADAVGANVDAGRTRALDTGGAVCVHDPAAGVRIPVKE
jgi:hypothetical protein